MKFTTWRAWLWNRLGRFLRRSRPRTLATATCTALGLATAWGGEAEAEVKFRIDITPTHDLMDAFVYYGTNSTGPFVRSLGEVKANTRQRFFGSIDHTDWGVPREKEDFIAKSFQPGSLYPPGFAVGGIYKRDEGYGITLSYPNAAPIESQVTWEEFSTYTQFEDIPYPYYDNPTEQAVVDAYFDGLQHAWSPWLVNEIYWGYTQLYNTTDWPEGYREEQYVTSYGNQATLISFGDTRFAGTATVTIVPEPSSAFYVVAFACITLVATAGRLTQGRAS